MKQTKYKQAFDLFFQGLTIKEIAERTGTDKSVIRSRLYKARKQRRKLL